MGGASLTKVESSSCIWVQALKLLILWRPGDSMIYDKIRILSSTLATMSLELLGLWIGLQQQVLHCVLWSRHQVQSKSIYLLYDSCTTITPKDMSFLVGQEHSMANVMLGKKINVISLPPAFNFYYIDKCLRKSASRGGILITQGIYCWFSCDFTVNGLNNFLLCVQ